MTNFINFVNFVHSNSYKHYLILIPPTACTTFITASRKSLICVVYTESFCDFHNPQTMVEWRKVSIVIFLTWYTYPQNIQHCDVYLPTCLHVLVSWWLHKLLLLYHMGWDELPCISNISSDSNWISVNIRGQLKLLVRD